jgi:adenosylcobyric acid synthase
MLTIEGRPDGAVSPAGRVMGCYLHGLFASDAFRHAFLARVAGGATGSVAYEAQVEAALDTLAAQLERELDLDRLFQLARQPMV